MRAVVVGAGPVGMFCGLSLARRGLDVVVVDRDAGPPAAGGWRRRGVMQFHLPHFFRPMVRQALQAELPDVWAAVVAAGGVPTRPAGAPEEMTALQCRRSTFERAVWSVAATEPGTRLLTGHADRLVVDRGRVTGVQVDGAVVDADLVVVATGRVGRFADELGRVGEGGPCGFSYVTRMYRARPGVEPPAGMPMVAVHDTPSSTSPPRRSSPSSRPGPTHSGSRRPPRSWRAAAWRTSTAASSTSAGVSRSRACSSSATPSAPPTPPPGAAPLRRFGGEDVDVDTRIPSDVVCAAGQFDPSILAAAGPYLGMQALPSVLDSVQEKARAVLRTGWRPPYADGPTRDELADGLLRPAA